MHLFHEQGGHLEFPLKRTSCGIGVGFSICNDLKTATKFLQNVLRSHIHLKLMKSSSR